MVVYRAKIIIWRQKPQYFPGFIFKKTDAEIFLQI